MLDLALLIFFFVMTFRVISAIHRETKIFQEFKQPKTMALAVMFFPLGPIVMLVGAARLPFPLAFVGGAACYIPALLIAHRVGKAFEKAGTDRVGSAQSAVSQAFGTALVGLGYVAFVLVFAIAVAAMDENA